MCIPINGLNCPHLLNTAFIYLLSLRSFFQVNAYINTDKEPFLQVPCTLEITTSEMTKLTQHLDLEKRIKRAKLSLENFDINEICLGSAWTSFTQDLSYFLSFPHNLMPLSSIESKLIFPDRPTLNSPIFQRYMS